MLFYDPCFWISEASDNINDFYFCPSKQANNNKGILISVDKGMMQDYRWTKNATSSANIKTLLPWSIVLSDNAYCNILRGTSILSFDTNRVDYACTNNVQVSKGKIINDQYLFNCKYKEKFTLKNVCLRKLFID